MQHRRACRNFFLFFFCFNTPHLSPQKRLFGSSQASHQPLCSEVAAKPGRAQAPGSRWAGSPLKSGMLACHGAVPGHGNPNQHQLQQGKREGFVTRGLG